MKLLLHTCCGPCLLYPLNKLHSAGIEVTGFFYNPNIHPYKEFKRRLDSLTKLAESENIDVVFDRNYGFDNYIKEVLFKEKSRCSICYDIRLEQTAKHAVDRGFDCFSTTLLYSRYQNHDLIKSKCEALASTYNISFVYKDFREGWQNGIDLAIEKNLYRQPYCGCIYSEQERYDNRLKKKLRKEKKSTK